MELLFGIVLAQYLTFVDILILAFGMFALCRIMILINNVRNK